MFLTTHAAVGVLISQQVDSPFWVFFLSLIAHFILDLIPHGDEELGIWLRQTRLRLILYGIIDLVIVTAFIITLYHQNYLPRIGLVSASLIGSILPDFMAHFIPTLHEKFSFMAVVRFLTNIGRKLGINNFIKGTKIFHETIHRLVKFELRPYQGYLLQMLILSASIFLTLRF